MFHYWYNTDPRGEGVLTVTQATPKVPTPVPRSVSAAYRAYTRTRAKTTWAGGRPTVPYNTATTGPRKVLVKNHGNTVKKIPRQGPNITSRIRTEQTLRLIVFFFFCARVPMKILNVDACASSLISLKTDPPRWGKKRNYCVRNANRLLKCSHYYCCYCFRCVFVSINN